MGKPSNITAGAGLVAAAALANVISHFPSLEGLGEVEHIAQNTRVFEGNGTPFLRVPGLKTLEKVAVGTQEVPLTEEREYPTDGTGLRLKSQTLKIVDVQIAPDGTPVLLRSIYSNDGIWQKGARIYVTGEFEADATGAATSDVK